MGKKESGKKSPRAHASAVPVLSDEDLALMLLYFQLESKSQAVSFYRNWYNEQIIESKIMRQKRDLTARRHHIHLDKMIKIEEDDRCKLLEDEAHLVTPSLESDPSIIALRRQIADLEQHKKTIKETYIKASEQARTYEDIIVSKVIEQQEQELALLNTLHLKAKKLQGKKLEDLHQRHEELLHMQDAMTATKMSDLGEHATQHELKNLSANHRTVARDNRRLNRELLTIRDELKKLTSSIRSLENNTISLMQHNNLEVDWNLRYDIEESINPNDESKVRMRGVKSPSRLIEKNLENDNSTLPLLPALPVMMDRPINSRLAIRPVSESVENYSLPAPVSPQSNLQIQSNLGNRHDAAKLTINNVFDQELQRLHNNLYSENGIATTGCRKPLTLASKQGGTQFYQ